jgi:hypothetical protein
MDHEEDRAESKPSIERRTPMPELGRAKARAQGEECAAECSNARLDPC